jgi:hypothetical protein
VSTLENFRFCNKCFALFFDGDDFKGLCPNDGQAHFAEGFMFVLDFGIKETPNAQGGWQQCGKCQVVFFDGRPEKGTCDAGGVHKRNRQHPFVIPHEVKGGPHFQAGWEFCTKCNAMFFDGFDTNGSCAAGGGHARHPDAFHFVLKHDPPIPVSFGDDNVGVPVDE